MRTLSAGSLAAGALLLCACGVKAPSTPGVCWRMAASPSGPPRFTPFATNNIANLETCAARLESQWLDDGRDLVGAYAGLFIFLDTAGVDVSNGLDAPRYRLFRPEDRRKIDQGLAQLKAQAKKR